VHHIDGELLVRGIQVLEVVGSAGGKVLSLAPVVGVILAGAAGASQLFSP
jgi:hypothetical protein